MVHFLSKRLLKQRILLCFPLIANCYKIVDSHNSFTLAYVKESEIIERSKSKIGKVGHFTFDSATLVRGTCFYSISE